MDLFLFVKIARFTEMVSAGGFHMIKNNTHRIAGIALFGALGFVLMFFSFPILPAVPYLKIDFSDLPLLLSYLLYGPSGGLISGIIRSILHYIQTGGDMGYPIGDTASFIASVAYCLPAYLIMRKYRSKKRTLMAFLVGTLSLTVVMTIANWFVITPLYLYLMNFSVGNLRDYLIAGVLPFNLIKGIIISAVFMAMMPKLEPWLVRQHKIRATK